MRFNIPDKRSADPADYKHLYRQGRLKQSWDIGVKRQRDGKQMVSFEDGLTWGSIGQILGYLLGDIDNDCREKLYRHMLNQYKQTDRGESTK